MSEWLTTGQMIDKLEVGEIAEGSTHWEVKRLPDGRIVELNSGDTFGLDVSFLNEQWRILPNFVSFEEAMKALKEGKPVYCHPNWSKGKHLILPKEAEGYALEGLSIRGEGLLGIVFESRWSIKQ